MPFTELTDEQKRDWLARLRKVHGPHAPLVLDQQLFQHRATAAFDDARPKGRKFRLYTEFHERRKEKQSDGTLAKVLTGQAEAQLWEEVNYGKNQPNEFWKGIKFSVAKDASYGDFEALFADAFAHPNDWNLRDE